MDAIELALTGGTPGDAYFILDKGTCSFHDMISAMAGAANVGLPEKSVPYWVAAIVARFCETLWRNLRLSGEPPLTRHAAMVMARECSLCGDKAKEELGYQPRFSVEEGILELSKRLNRWTEDWQKTSHDVTEQDGSESV